MRLKPLITWSDNMSVGHGDLDDDHKLMITEIGLLYSYRTAHSRAEVRDRFSTLARHAIDHFHNEERYMESIAYGDSPRHGETHAAFLEQIRALEDRMRNDQSYELADGDLNALARWLFNHIHTEDKDYAVWAARRRSKGRVLAEQEA